MLTWHIARPIRLLFLVVSLTACREPGRPQVVVPPDGDPEIDARLAHYATVEIPVDVSGLPVRERRLLRKLAQAAGLIERAYWEQAHPGGWELRGRLQRSRSPAADKALRLLVANAAPFDLRRDSRPFLGTAVRPAGGGLYPPDLDRGELEAYLAAHPAERSALSSPRTVIRRRAGRLVAVPYHEEYATWIGPAAARIDEAAALAGSPGFSRFLHAVAELLRTDRPAALDHAWLFEPGNRVTVTLGPPVWQGGDALLGVKAAYSLSVGVKNPRQDERARLLLDRLDELQRNLPLDPGLRPGTVETDLVLAVADDLARGGLAAHGQQQSAPLIAETAGPGTGGHLVLSNIFNARFHHLFLAKAGSFLDPASSGRLTFQGYFDTVLAHYVGHALGPDRSSRKAAGDRLGPELDRALEEVKAEALGLLALGRLRERGEIPATLAVEHETAHLAHMFLILHDNSRSRQAPNHWVRASLLTLAWHRERGALSFEAESGRWSVHPGRVGPSAEALAREILAIQATADRPRAERLLARAASTPEELQRTVEAIDAVRPTQVVPRLVVRW